MPVLAPPSEETPEQLLQRLDPGDVLHCTEHDDRTAVCWLTCLHCHAHYPLGRPCADVSLVFLRRQATVTHEPCGACAPPRELAAFAPIGTGGR